MSYTYQGYFKPKNPSKYIGNSSNIIYRSSWELKLMGYLDSHPSILKWSSEELAIPYFSPVDRRLHRYFPDFLIQKKDVKGTTSTVLVEVKPKNQTQPPKKKTRTTKKYINEVKTYAINEAKWKAALEYCKDRGWEFMIMTEKELGIK